jgi:hypothetical protein
MKVRDYTEEERAYIKAARNFDMALERMALVEDRIWAELVRATFPDPKEEEPEDG